MAILAIPRAREFLTLLYERLPEKTIRHVISVASWAETAAPYAGTAPASAVHAGLLHDLCKKMKADELLEHAERFEVPLTDVTRRYPKLLHGPVAAETARRELGIDDDVYEAVYWHTTGRPGLGRLGQLLYFADFTEPFRNYAEAPEGRALLYDSGFDAALRFVARAKLGYVKKREAQDPIANEFLEWLEQNDR